MIWSCNCLGIINPSRSLAHHRRTAATRVRLSPAMLRVTCRRSLFSCSLWMIVPYPTDLTSRTDGDSEHYRSCWRILIRPSWWWRYRSVGGEWFVKPTIFFSLFSVGARQFWVAQRSLGFSLGLSCCMVGHDWGIPYPIHFILIEDQVRIYVMHFSTRYCG